VKVFDADENRMIGLPYGDTNYDDMLSRFHLVTERNVMLTRDKNQDF